MLQAECAHLLWRWSDEYDAVGGALFSEVGILAEKPVAGVNGLRAGAPRGFEQGRGGKIALRGRGRTNGDRFIRLFDVQGVPIRLRIDGDGSDAHPPQRTDDSAGDGAPIRD